MSESHTDWDQYEKLVLDALKTLREDIKDVKQDINALKVELATLKANSGLWGTMGGIIPAGIALAWSLLK